MGLLKARDAASAPAAAEPSATPQDLLASPDPVLRRGAARALGGDPSSVPALAAALSHETERAVQQALVGALAEAGTQEAVSALAGMLRHEDAWLRNAVTDALLEVGPRAADALHAHLADPDPDWRIAAVTTLAGLGGGHSEAWLIERLAQESETNVLAALIEALDLAGSEAAIPALDGVIARCQADPFLAFAAAAVRARLAHAPG